MNCKEQVLTTETLTPRSYNLVQLFIMMREIFLLFFNVDGQRSRSYCYIVGILFRQNTERTVSSRFIHIKFITVMKERCLLFFKISQRSHCNRVWNRCRINCRQDIAAITILFFKIWYFLTRPRLHRISAMAQHWKWFTPAVFWTFLVYEN